MKQTLKVGDVFLVPLGDGRARVGQIVGKYGKHAYYLAIFDRTLSSRDDVLAMKAPASEAIVFLALALDAKFYVGHWMVIGNADVPVNVPFPAYKVAVGFPPEYEVVDYTDNLRRRATTSEIERLPNRTIVAPVLLELALKAEAGMGPWNDAFDKFRVSEGATSAELFGEKWDVPAKRGSPANAHHLPRKFEESDLIAELSEVGVNVASIWDLVNSPNQFVEALPVLQRWIRVLDQRQATRESNWFADGIVRAATVPKARPWLAPDLVDQFRRADHSQPAGLGWTLGNALSVVADDSVFDDLVELSTDSAYGRSRQGVVLALGRSKMPAASRGLVGLLADEDVKGHALVSLRKLKPAGARVDVQRLTQDPNPWIRKEAAKTLRVLPL